MHCISVNYHKTPLQMRECLAFTMEEKEAFEEEVNRITGGGCVIISTCNRTELYFTGAKEAIYIVEERLASYKGISLLDLKKNRFLYSKEGAIKHLCQVSCGIESMVIGEDEILRQVKDAYYHSLALGTTDSELNIIFQGAIGTAKAVKTDTKLSTTPVSIGTLTVKEIMKFLPDHMGNILIIGVFGKMGSIIVKNLIGLLDKSMHIVGTSRTHGNRIIIPVDWQKRCNGAIVKDTKEITVIPYEERYQYIGWADVIVSATSSPHYTVLKEEASPILSAYKKDRLWIDLAVPSDIDPRIKELQQVHMIDIDDFELLAKSNLLIRDKEVEKASQLIEDKVEEIRKSLSMQKLGGKMDIMNQLVEKKGIAHVIYQLKGKLSADQLENLVIGLGSIIEEELK